MRAEHQSRLERLVSKALDVYETALDSKDGHLSAATATKILEGSGVLDKRGSRGRSMMPSLETPFTRPTCRMNSTPGSRDANRGG